MTVSMLIWHKDIQIYWSLAPNVAPVYSHWFCPNSRFWLTFQNVAETDDIGMFCIWIIIGSDRRPETKQGIEGKIDRFRSGRLGIGLGTIDPRSEVLNQIADLNPPVKFRSLNW